MDFVHLILDNFSGADMRMDLFIRLNEDNIENLEYLKKLYEDSESYNENSFELKNIYSEKDVRYFLFSANAIIENIAKYDFYEMAALDGILNIPQKSSNESFEEWFENNFEFIKSLSLTKMLKNGKIFLSKKLKRLSFDEYIKKILEKK